MTRKLGALVGSFIAAALLLAAVFGLVSRPTAVLAAPTGAGADLSLSEADSPDPVLVGQSMTYTVVLINNGPITATNVVLTDTYPGFAILHGGSFSRQGVPCGGAPWVCPIGDMFPGEVLTAELYMTATKFAVPSMSNVVSVAAIELDPNQANNSSTETTTVLAPTDPVLIYSPGAISVTLEYGESTTATIQLAKNSITNVAYTATLSNQSPWLIFESVSGVITTDSSITLSLPITTGPLMVRGISRENLIIESNDPQKPVVTIPITLRVTMADMNVVPPFDMDVTAGFTTATEIWVQNFGDAQMNWEVAGPLPISLFFWLDPWVGTVGPSETQVVKINYDATDKAPGRYEYRLCLKANDPVEPVECFQVVMNVLEPKRLFLPMITR